MIRLIFKRFVYGLVFLIALYCSYVICYAGTTDVLKDGLLGAASGAVGGAASGGKSGDLWKGALAGAGTNVVGGALLDTISGKKEETKTVYVEHQAPVETQVIYRDRIVEKPVEKIVYVEKEPHGWKKRIEIARQEGYSEGYRAAMMEVIDYCKGRI